jgi:hypothetical protein
MYVVFTVRGKNNIHRMYTNRGFMPFVGYFRRQGENNLQKKKKYHAAAGSGPLSK